MISKDNLEEQIHNISKQTIQKPKSLCKLIGMTLKNGEKALEYQLPSITKKVTMTEFYSAYIELERNGFINHSWYTRTFPEYDSNSPCNFTTIGAVFVEINLSEYKNNKYWKK